MSEHYGHVVMPWSIQAMRNHPSDRARSWREVEQRRSLCMNNLGVGDFVPTCELRLLTDRLAHARECPAYSDGIAA